MMLSDSIETRTIEVELALRNWNGIFPNECPEIDADYYFEDRRENGCGLVIGNEIPPTGNLNQAIIDFLNPIVRNAEALRAFSPVLQVTIYNHAFTCSMTIKCISLIADFGAELDIDVYPTAAESKKEEAGSSPE